MGEIYMIYIAKIISILLALELAIDKVESDDMNSKS